MNTAHISTYCENPKGHTLDLDPILDGTTTLPGIFLDTHLCTIVSDYGFYHV